jgi:peptide deformylase
VIINPVLQIEETAAQVEFFEGCLSVPGYVGLVPRAQEVRVECLNERAEPVAIHAQGWYARILQHEIDNLKSTINLDRALLRTWMTNKNYELWWQNRTVQEVKAMLAPGSPAGRS